MLRGILKTRSVDINNFQKLVDPLMILTIFIFIFNKETFNVNFNYFTILIIDAVILNINKIYESYRVKKLINVIPKLFFISSSVTIVNIIIAELNSQINGLFLLSYFSLIFIYLFIHHFLLRLFLRKIRAKGFNLRNAIFFGNESSYILVKKQLKETPWLGYKIINWFSPNSDDFKNRSKTKFKESFCNGGIEELINTFDSNNIDKIFFSHDDSDEISFSKILKILGDSCIPVSYMLDWNTSSLNLRKEYFGEITAINIWNPNSSIFNQQIKRLFDFFIAISIFIFLVPIFVLISILIKFNSKGPILYCQKRYGLNGKVFTMYKFRTMFQDKNSKKFIQAKIGDKRVTKIGKYLRKYSLDELPQLINVIKGEMSLVGPRPHAAEQNEYYRSLILGYMQRHSRLPGMTGLAQINGARGQTSDINLMKLRIKYDLEYNDNWNLLKDFSILLKTFICVLKGSAY